MSIKRIPLAVKSSNFEYSVKITGKDYNGNLATIYLPDTSLALISPPGFGKTFFIKEHIKQSINNSNSVTIVFDAKAELVKELYRPGDVIISSKPICCYPVAVWNLFSEIYAGPNPISFANEITQMLFSSAIKLSQNPSFPKAASQKFYALLYALIKENKTMSNDVLMYIAEGISDKRLLELSKQYPELRFLKHLVGKSDTAFGIDMELTSCLEYFFKRDSLFRSQKGEFSIRKFIRNSRGKKLFIVYPFNENESSSAVTSLLLDIAMKEIISGNDLSNGDSTRYNLYLDEFACLPSELTYLTRVNNFGRSKGARIIAGIQNFNQLISSYGEADAENLLASFNSLVAFSPNDEVTRSKIKERCGKKNYTITPMCDVIHGGDIVTDQDLQSLRTAEAIMILNSSPFFFDFYNAF